MNRSGFIFAKSGSRQTAFPSFFFSAVLVYLLFCTGIIAQAIPRLDGKTYRILQIDSYTSGDPFSRNLSKGIKKTLNQKDIMTHYEGYELGIRYRLENSPSPEDIKAIRTKLKNTSYDLLILNDNAAADLFLDGRIPQPEGTPILIASYHGPLGLKLQGKTNITGIETKSLWFQNTFFATKLFPETRSFALVIEAGAAGKAQLQSYQEMLAENQFLLNIPIQLISGNEYSTDEMFNKVLSLPPQTILFFHSWSSVKDTKLAGGNLVLPRLRSIFPGLIIGKYESYVQHGAAGGVTNSGRLQGELAGRIAYQLLSGIPASSLPVQQGPTHTLLQYDTLKRFDIPSSSIPVGTELVNPPPTLFGLYRQEWLADVLFCVFILVAGMFILLYRRHQTRRIETMLTTAAEMAEVVAFRCDLNGRIKQPIRNPHFWPMQNGKSVPAELWIFPEYMKEFRSVWQRLCNGTTDSASLKYIAGAPGRKFYFEMRIRKVPKPSGGSEFFGIIQDITEARKNEMLCQDNLLLLNSLIDNLPGYLFVKKANDDFRYMLANSRFSEMINLPKEQIIGHTDSEIFSHAPELADKYHADDLEALNSGKLHEFQETLIDKHGKKYIVRTMKDSLTLSDGTRLLLGIGINTTKLHELEKKQKETIRQLDAAVKAEQIINESLTRIMTAPDLHTAINDMLAVIGSHSGADRCYIFRYTAAHFSRATCEYEWCREGIRSVRASLQDAAMPDIDAWKEQIQSETAIAISDVDELPKKFYSETEHLRNLNIRSALVAGIRINGEIYGFVSVDFIRERRIFSDSDIQMVYSIARLFQLARERFLNRAVQPDTAENREREKI